MFELLFYRNIQVSNRYSNIHKYTYLYGIILNFNVYVSVPGKAVPFVELTVAHASVLTILAISFERYYAICEPLKAGYVCTKARALLICLAAWAVAAVFTR